MLGETAEARAFTRSKERYIELQLFSRLVRLIHATNSPLGLPANPALAENENKYLPEALTRIDTALEDCIYVMGDNPTIADCTLLAGIRFANLFGWETPPNYANLQRWFEHFSARHPMGQT